MVKNNQKWEQKIRGILEKLCYKDIHSWEEHLGDYENFKNLLHPLIEKHQRAFEDTKILIMRWSVSSPYGRQTWFFSKKKDLLEDKNARKRVQTWFFAFLDEREDYLIERFFKWMDKNRKERICVDINFTNNCSFKQKNNGKYTKFDINIPSLEKVKPQEVLRHLNKMIENDKKDIDDIQLARYLRKDKKLHERRAKYIAEFKKWWHNHRIDGHKNTCENQCSLLNFLRQFYEVGDNRLMPFYPEQEIKGLISIFQNIYIYFGSFPKKIRMFLINKSIHQNRVKSCFAIFYKSENDYNTSLCEEVFQGLEKIEDKIWSNGAQKRCCSGTEIRWLEDLKRSSDVKNLASDLPNSAMELTRHLAFSRHEGIVCNYAFIVGDDKIWPAIQEIVSLDFIKDHQATSSLDAEPEFMANLCQTNYSIFQIPGVVGYFNIFTEKLESIIRLKWPSTDELATSKYQSDNNEIIPIVDLDDLYCWVLDWIYKWTRKCATILSTTGYGKVYIYKKQEGKAADLQLIWDLIKAKVYAPIEKKEKQKIERFLENKKYFSNKILKLIREISSAQNEGGFIILVKENIVNNYNNYLVKMEIFEPEWLRNLSLESFPEFLKAAIITDGATLIDLKKQKVSPRNLVYTFKNNKAYGYVAQEDGGEEIKRKMMGKGSKTHGALNLSKILKNKNLKNEVLIITVSADGPIKVWDD